MLKKMELYLLLLVVACFIPKSAGRICRKNLREFEIFQSIKVGSDNFERTSLEVIINLENYDIDEMFEKVKEEYDLMNGHAENLTIRLYDSRESLKNGDCLGEKVYSDCGKI